MLKEHDLVALTADIQNEEGDLRAGDVGTIVHVHPGGEAFVVEFTTLYGSTVAIATVLSSQARPVGDDDVTHARKLALAV